MIAKTSSSFRFALVTLGCALLALVAVPAIRATTADAAKPAAAKLPLTATFEKVTTAEAGPPYVLHLKNDSKATVKVSGKVLLSVAFHSSSKARNVPEHAIEAGASWSIGELAANDKVILTAEGFAPMELTVP